MDRDQLLNDPETAFRVGLDGRQSTMWTAMPGIVISVNPVAMTVVVQVAIMGMVSDSTGNDIPTVIKPLPDVPIVFPSGGGFALTFPIIPGDEGLVVFGSRCIDSWWQNSGIGIPMENRMHDLSDGFFIPGPKSQPNVLPSVSATAVQLRNKLGTTYVGIDAAGLVQFKNPVTSLKVTLNGMLDLLTNLQTALTAFAGVAATDPIAAVTAGAATTLDAALPALSAAITAYKTAVIGGLLE